MSKMLKQFDDNGIRVKRQQVLNKVAEHLVEKEMLPAICYVFSRKQLEICAHEVTTNLLEFDSKVSYTIDRDCEQIIRKLPNFKEYRMKLVGSESPEEIREIMNNIASEYSGFELN